MIVKATRIHLQSSDSDSGPDDRNPPPSKKDKSKDKSGPPMENGEPTWELEQTRRSRFESSKEKPTSTSENGMLIRKIWKRSM